MKVQSTDLSVLSWSERKFKKFSRICILSWRGRSSTCPTDSARGYLSYFPAPLPESLQSACIIVRSATLAAKLPEVARLSSRNLCQSSLIYPVARSHGGLSSLFMDVSVGSTAREEPAYWPKANSGVTTVRPAEVVTPKLAFSPNTSLMVTRSLYWVGWGNAVLPVYPVLPSFSAMCFSCEITISHLQPCAQQFPPS